MDSTMRTAKKATLRILEALDDQHAFTHAEMRAYHAPSELSGMAHDPHDEEAYEKLERIFERLGVDYIEVYDALQEAGNIEAEYLPRHEISLPHYAMMKLSHLFDNTADRVKQIRRERAESQYWHAEIDEGEYYDIVGEYPCRVGPEPAPEKVVITLPIRKPNQ